MFSLINIAESYTFFGAQLLFFLNFLSIIFLSYSSGYLLANKKIQNNTFQYSFVSLILFSAIIGITVNFFTIYAKNIITIFYLLNISLFIINKSIRKKFLEILIKNIKFFIVVFLFYIYFNNFYYPVAELDNNKLNIIYYDDYSYFYNPIREILFSDYSSRIRISTLYPMEWGSYYFFQAGFNAIFLKTIASSGLVGYLYLKNFFLSFFYSSLVFYGLDRNPFNKKISLVNTFFSLVIICIIFYFHKTMWFMTTNGFVSVCLALFIADAIIRKKNKNVYLWCILLALTSLKFAFISFFIYFFYLFQDTKIDFKKIFFKLKKNIEYIDALFIILLVVYLISTFINSTAVNPTFNLPGKIVTGWWEMTISQNTIINKNILGLNLLFFSTFYFFLMQKKYVKINLYNYNLNMLYYVLIVFLIPFLTVSLIYLKDFLFELSEHKKLDIFISSINLDNMLFYCYVPIIWFLFLVNFSNSIKYLFLALITWHTFLSIFINHSVILPSLYLIELIILIYCYFFILSNKNKFKDNLYVFFFIFVVFINVLVIKDFSKQDEHVHKIQLDFLKLKEVASKDFLCANDIKQFNVTHKKGLLPANIISSLLGKNYYTEILYLKNFNRHDYWNDGTARWAVVPKKIETSECLN